MKIKNKSLNKCQNEEILNCKMNVFSFVNHTLNTASGYTGDLKCERANLPYYRKNQIQNKYSKF